MWTCWIRKIPKNWRWPHSISVVAHLWQPFPRNNIMCTESHGAAACTNILDTRWARFYRIKCRDIGERDGKVLTQLTFSSSLPQSCNVALVISALYLRISALKLLTVNIITLEVRIIDLRTAQVYCFAIFLTCWHPSHITISFLFNSTFYLCMIIVIFYLMYLIHLLKLLAIVHHTFCANVFVIQTKVLHFIVRYQSALS